MRKIKVDGVVIAAEKITRPVKGRRGRAKSRVRLIVESLRDGESARIPSDKFDIDPASTYKMGQALGCRVNYRRVGDVIEIYRSAT